MRPTPLRLLEDELLERILEEARNLLWQLGVELHNPPLRELLAGHGARIDPANQRVRLPPELVDQALASAPGQFTMYDSTGQAACTLGGSGLCATPGSAAINLLDGETGKIRRPTSRDYWRYVKLVAGLEALDLQSTAFIPADVPAILSDAQRLHLSLLGCTRPVVTGAFTIAGFEIMRDLLLAVRGSADALHRQPLAIFSACPTAPLRWSDVTSQNLVDCARLHIPVEYISMPLSGFMAPVTLVGTLVQHTAETLSGVVLSQLTSPGTPILYGGSPAIFDVRYETTPMGALETMMTDCAFAQIGHHLGLPTQAYISLSDAKQLDAQAGLEAALGTTLAGLTGINLICGAGMLDFESCHSMEKLVVDAEILRMIRRLRQGITPREDFPARPLFEEMLESGHLLIAPHTRRHLREEITFPGPTIDRASRNRWQEEGEHSLIERARLEVDRLVRAHKPPPLPGTVVSDLQQVMDAAARAHGGVALPSIEESAG